VHELHEKEVLLYNLEISKLHLEDTIERLKQVHRLVNLGNFDPASWPDMPVHGIACLKPTIEEMQSQVDAFTPQVRQARWQGVQLTRLRTTCRSQG
jgi:hypothetical protein